MKQKRSASDIKEKEAEWQKAKETKSNYKQANN